MKSIQGAGQGLFYKDDQIAGSNSYPRLQDYTQLQKQAECRHRAKLSPTVRRAIKT